MKKFINNYKGSFILLLTAFIWGIAFVFQNYALFPLMNVYDNLAFGLRMKKVEEMMPEPEPEPEPVDENPGIDIEKKEEISIDDFAKVDLRVAQIVECEPVKKAKKLLKLTLDDGSAEKRTVASGIALYYKPEELIGKKVILVQNLKPATLCGVESQGMILAADCDENDVKVIFVDNMPVGAKIR